MTLGPSLGTLTDVRRQQFAKSNLPVIRGTGFPRDTVFVETYLPDDTDTPRLPIERLAGRLGIRTAFTDAAGDLHFQVDPDHPDEVAFGDLQLMTDGLLAAAEDEIAVRSSRHGTGTLVAPAAVDRLGHAGLDALTRAGYIVRIPDSTFQDGIVRDCSIFPNPTKEFWDSLAQKTGVVIDDQRGPHSSPYQPPVESASANLFDRSRPSYSGIIRASGRSDQLLV